MSFFSVLSGLIQLYTLAIIIWVIASWVPNMQRNRFVQQVGRIVEPYLSIFRKVIPSLGGIDVSPILAILALQLLKSLFFRFPFLI